jgi:thioredoxin-related protein
MTWAEVQEAQKKEPRKVFIDTYTDWCGWCKKMDQYTFTHPEIISYMNENFYAIKFDAESREVVRYRDKDYKFVASGNRGYNELAAELLKGRLSYPTTVYLDENMDLLFPVPGYLEPKILEQLLHFVGGNNYKTMTFDIFQPKFQGKVQ